MHIYIVIYIYIYGGLRNSRALSSTSTPLREGPNTLAVMPILGAPKHVWSRPLGKRVAAATF